MPISLSEMKSYLRKLYLKTYKTQQMIYVVKIKHHVFILDEIVHVFAHYFCMCYTAD